MDFCIFFIIFFSCFFFFNQNLCNTNIIKEGHAINHKFCQHCLRLGFSLNNFPHKVILDSNNTLQYIKSKKKTSFYIIHMHNQMNLYHCLSYGINNISLSLSCFNSMANYIFSHLGYSLFTTWFTTMGFYSPNAPIILKNWEVFFPTNNLVLI